MCGLQELGTVYRLEWDILKTLMTTQVTSNAE
jgi:hypothetical protein